MGGGTSRKQRPKVTADMLLLGAPSVGKSTIFRQMKLLYRGGFTAEERRRSRIELRRNLLASMLKLDEIALQKGLNLESEEVEEAVTALKLAFQDYTYDERDDANCIDAAEEDEGPAKEADILSEPLPFPAAQVKSVMSDGAIQQALKLVSSGEYKPADGDSAGSELLQEAFPYVTGENFDRIVSADFVPTDLDCLHLRRHTTSVERIEFVSTIRIRGREEQVHCTCTDIGGQAQEQKKWEAQAGSVDFIVFVAAMSDFDRFRQGGQNALEHQFEMLERILAAKCFRDKNVIVLLNKVDALELKLETVNLKDFFPQYTGENSVDDAKQFFEKRCAAINEKLTRNGVVSESRQVQVVPTCALDKNLLHNVLSSALGAGLMSALMEVGIV